MLLLQRMQNKFSAFAKFISCKYNCNFLFCGVTSSNGASLVSQCFFFTCAAPSDSFAANK
jgi:hypothetical protein